MEGKRTGSERFQSDVYRKRPATTVQAPGWVESLLPIAPWAAALCLCLIIMVKVELNTVATATCVVVLATVVWVLKTMVMTSERMPTTGKAVLITGCDSGFGYWLARHLDGLGAVVFAGCLHADGEGAVSLKTHCSDRVHVMQMDVTSDEQVQECLHYVQDVLKKLKQPGLWGVVNNAGLCYFGDIELSTMRHFQSVTEVNQLGMVRVTKTFLALLRIAKGRVVNVTSIKGRASFPFNGAYTMTKYAGEAFSDALRMEMAKFGIKVSVIQPCNFGGSTEGLNPAIRGPEFEEMWQGMTPEARDIYGLQYLQKQFEVLMSITNTANFNLFPITDAIADALFSLKPQRRYFVGGGSEWYDMYKVIGLIVPWLPSWLSDWYIMRCSEPFCPPLQREDLHE